MATSLTNVAADGQRREFFSDDPWQRRLEVSVISICRMFEKLTAMIFRLRFVCPTTRIWSLARWHRKAIVMVQIKDPVGLRHAFCIHYQDHLYHRRCVDSYSIIVLWSLRCLIAQLFYHILSCNNLFFTQKSTYITKQIRITKQEFAQEYVQKSRPSNLGVHDLCTKDRFSSQSIWM